MKRPSLKIPVYDAVKDGNVFYWLLNAAEDFRKMRQRQRYVELEKAQFIEREKTKNDNNRRKCI